jgi:hypothetical protein
VIYDMYVSDPGKKATLMAFVSVRVVVNKYRMLSRSQQRPE